MPLIIYIKGEITARYFSSESVTEDIRDKVSDIIADSILDAILTKDPKARVAVEVSVTLIFVLFMHEVSRLMLIYRSCQRSD